MKIAFSLDGINQTIKNLNEVGVVINTNFKSELLNQGNELRDKAKQILEEQSQLRTNKRYWTGRLQNAIKTKMVTNETEMTGVEVGVDLRSARHGEWVEIGHRVANPYTGKVIAGSWWEGYHYLEGAYLEVSPTIAKQIGDTLKVSLTHFARLGGRTRSKSTGRFTKGNFIN
jgi:hypothetical protein